MADDDSYTDADIERIYTGLASSYRWMSLINDTAFGAVSLRRSLMTQASGRVLDVACGTGENFRYLRSADEVIAIDISSAMLDRARDCARRLGLDVDLRRMSAQQLDFPDGTFDVVTTAMSTCTFPDPITALREMARVTRPGGRILLVEHGRSRVGWIARLQQRRAAAHYRQAGCRWDQDVLGLLRDGGLHVHDIRTRTLGVFVGVAVSPGPG